MPVKFDINETLAQMLGAVKDTVKDNWSQVVTPASQFLQNRKDRLALLSDLLISGDLTKKKFLSRLEDEKLVLQAELHAVAVLTKATAQRAANAAIDALKGAVSAVIKGVL